MTNPNDPTNPLPDITTPNGDIIFGSPGLTKREYFAALAMQGILAHTANGEATDASVATWAVQQADALIAELNKPKP